MPLLYPSSSRRSRLRRTRSMAPSLARKHSKLSLKTILQILLPLALGSVVVGAFSNENILSNANTKRSRSFSLRQETTNLCAASSFVLDIDNAEVLSGGSMSFPPMVSVPCSFLEENEDDDDDDGPHSLQQRRRSTTLTELVKPPNVEELYDWYVSTKNQPHADPSWGVLWPTAVSLANYLWDQQLETESSGTSGDLDLRDKTVIELGAGLGLCGLTAAALGADSVVLTDREPYALHCALATAACNSLHVNGAILDWTNDHQLAQCSGADVVLASDVLYDGDTIRALAHAVGSLVDPHKGGVLLLADPTVERFPGARQQLKDCLLGESSTRTHDNMHWEVLDLPVYDTIGAATTMDGRDHEERMKEATVLIKCTFGPKVEQLIAIQN